MLRILGLLDAKHAIQDYKLYKLIMIFIACLLVFGCSTNRKFHIYQDHFNSQDFELAEYFKRNCDYNGNTIESADGRQVYGLVCSEKNYSKFINQYGKFLEGLSKKDPVDAGFVKIKKENTSGNLETYKFVDMHSERTSFGSPAFSKLLIFAHYENHFDQKGTLRVINVDPMKLEYHGSSRPNLNVVDRFQLLYGCNDGKVRIEAKDRLVIYTDSIEATANLEFNTIGSNVYATLTSDSSVGTVHKFDLDTEVKIISAANNEIILDSFNMTLEKGGDLYKFIRNPENNGHGKVYTKEGDKIDITIFSYVNVALENELEKLCPLLK